MSTISTISTNSTIENAIFKAKVNGELKQIFFSTGVDNVVIYEDDKEILLSQKLAEIVASIENTMTLDAVQTKIEESISYIVDSAPESLDTLRELAEAVTENAEIMDTLNSAIADKVSVEDGKELISTALLDTLASLDFDVLASISAEKLAELEKAEENVIDTIKVNGLAVDITDKSVDISVPTITISADEPSSINEGDLFLQIIE